LIARAKSTILVVEDEAELLDLIARILRRSGYEILEAQTSPEAISICQQSPVDLILSDFNLPGGNGLQLAQILRGTYADVPVVFMSGNREACDGIVEQGYVCLRKPFSFADMEETLGEILSERRPLSADA
jgi:CheY-like chemotaxis protein